MGTVDDAVGNKEETVEDYFISTEKEADPVLYQLVRVDDSGRLVPATDDEVITVEDLLGSDRTQGGIVPKTEQTPGCSTKYECCSDNVQLKGSEGVEQIDKVETIAGTASVSPDSEKIDARHQETTPLTSTAGILAQSGRQERCSKLRHQSESSHSTNTSSKPDFSLLKGEIRLDDLTVRDLQETFKATFGRETSVKDKQWLKRRIIMGLTNSCDFSTTTLVVPENEVVNKCEVDTFKITDQKVLTYSDSGIDSDKWNGTHSNASVMKIEKSTILDNSACKDSHADGRPVKRVRKPTRRYIESSEGDTADDQPTNVVSTRPIHNTRLETTFLFRKDSIGGSGVEVPYVSRIRRSRPRESFATLSKIQKIGMDMSPTRLTKNDNLVESSKLHGIGSGNKVYGANSSPREIQDHPVTLPERSKLYIEQNAVNLEKEMELESMESCKNSSDEDMVTFPTANGGMRRKHHRPWAISEVVKLVDGVAKYGVGRWSEIKRLAFASYSYRTPVDLKDKWRNLLKASVAEVPGKNQTQASRKQASAPIPAPILSRVRELANIHQAPTPVIPSSSKLAGYNKTSKNLQAGFL